MTRSNDLVTFLFEFYNYVKLVKDDRTLDDKKSEIAKLVEDIDAQKLSSLYSRASKNKKRSRRGEGHGDTNDGADRSSSKHIRTVMTGVLRESGFKLRDQYIGGFEPLVEVSAQASQLFCS